MQPHRMLFKMGAAREEWEKANQGYRRGAKTVKHTSLWQVVRGPVDRVRDGGSKQAI